MKNNKQPYSSGITGQKVGMFPKIKPISPKNVSKLILKKISRSRSISRSISSRSSNKEKKKTKKFVQL